MDYDPEKHVGEFHTHTLTGFVEGSPSLMPSIKNSDANGDAASADWHTKTGGQNFYGYMGTYLKDGNVFTPVFWQYGPTLSDEPIQLEVREAEKCKCIK